MATPKASKDGEVDWIARLSEVREELSGPDFFNVLGQNVARWAQQVTVGDFWVEAAARLPRWGTEYRSQVRSKSAPMLPRPGLPNFEAKSPTSIRDKLVRQCESRPAEFAALVPTKGPPVPQLNDLVRTRVSCSYVDGVDFLANKLADVADEMGVEPELSREGRIEGYFAQHLTVKQTVIYSVTGHEDIASIRCEIQLASQLATQVWQASHPLYEQVRGGSDTPEDWQWKPNDPRFTANQLGHMIHLADGLLVQLRDKGLK